MPSQNRLPLKLHAAWSDFRLWPRSAQRTSAGLLVLIGLFLPAACSGEDEEDSDAGLTTTTTTAATTTTEAATTTAAPPPTTGAPVTTEAPPPPPVTDAPRPAATAAPSAPSGATYANCSEAKAAGAAPLSRGEPGYSSKLDRDGDGVACET